MNEQTSQNNQTTQNQSTDNVPNNLNNIPSIITNNNTPQTNTNNTVSTQPEININNTSTINSTTDLNTLPDNVANTNLNSTPSTELNNASISPETNNNTNNISSNELNNNSNNNPEIITNNNIDNTIQNTSSKTTKKTISPIIIIAIILVIGVGAYFVYNKFFNNNTTSTTNNENTNKNTNTNNTNDIYKGEKIYEIPMGVGENGVYKKYCTIKIGGDLISSGDAYNTAGKKELITNFPPLKINEVYEKIDFNNYFATIITGINDDIHISFSTTTIRYGSVNSWEDIKKDYEKNNKKVTDLGTNNHPAYFTRISQGGVFDVNLLYKLDNDWVLAINYRSDLTSKLSDKELSEKLYSLVTPA